MATYPRCRECGNDLTSQEEQEQELCFGCQEQEFDTCPECGATLVHNSGLENIPEYLYCPYCLDKGYDYDGTVLFRIGG